MMGQMSPIPTEEIATKEIVVAAEETVANIIWPTREQWLVAAVDEFRPHYTANKLEIPTVLVSCGWPSHGGLSKNRVRGECWNAACAADGSRHIFISPFEGDPLEVLGVLTHELVHSALQDDAKHGKKFKEAMILLGLEGRPKTAMPGPQLRLIIEGVFAKLGDYPHSALTPKEKKDRKNTKKTFKMFCSKMRACEKGCLILDQVKESDYTVTAGTKSLKLGMPNCPCGNEMEMEPEDYELYKLAVSD